MNMRTLFLCVAALFGACSTNETQSPASAAITGTASYRERMMLAPGGSLEVTLEDVSRADAPADVIARTEVPTTNAPPYSFTLSYDPARITSGHRYNVRARITVDGQLQFQSDAGYAVLGTGNVTNVDILLKRASAAAASASVPSENLRGMYSYMADAGWFVDCRSGARLAVAQEGDNAALEHAYSMAKHEGAPMLATVEGRVEDRMPMEGPGPRPTLIVQKFVSLTAEGCSGPQSIAQLANTYWKLMTLNGTPAESPPGTREIQMVLNSEDLRVNGFAGCNRFSGGYRVEGAKIEFTNVAGTMMACAGGGMELEQRFHKMLGSVAGWKISGETLQLTNAQGMTVATFESRYMK